MAWTTPATVNPGDPVSSTWANTYIRDNMNYALSGRAYSVGAYQAASNYTVSATSFTIVDTTNLSVTMNVSSGRIGGYWAFPATWGNGGFTARIDLDTIIDGTTYMGGGTNGRMVVKQQSSGVLDRGLVIVPVTYTGLAVGSHTFKLVAKVDTGSTLTIYGTPATVSWCIFEI